MFKKLGYGQPNSFFPIATCKVEVYGTQREFGTETCELKLPFPFVPHTLLLYRLQQ